MEGRGGESGFPVETLMMSARPRCWGSPSAVVNQVDGMYLDVTRRVLISMFFHRKHHNPSLIMRRTSDTSVRSSLHSPTPALLTTVKVIEKKSPRNCPSQEKPHKTGQLDITYVSWMGSREEEGRGDKLRKSGFLTLPW